MNKYIIFTILIFGFIFTSCKNVKIDDDYYYEETETVNGMKITLKGKGYGVYGQMLEKYKTGSIKDLMAGTPMKIRTNSVDDNNSSYNEIFLTFEKNGYIDSFETDIEVLKLHGLAQIRVYYVDYNDKETSLYTNSNSPYISPVNVDVQKEVKSITLYIKGNKFYPPAYNSVAFRENLTETDFEELKGKQVDNEFTIKYVRIN